MADAHGDDTDKQVEIWKVKRVSLDSRRIYRKCIQLLVSLATLQL